MINLKEEYLVGKLFSDKLKVRELTKSEMTLYLDKGFLVISLKKLEQKNLGN